MSNFWVDAEKLRISSAATIASPQDLRHDRMSAGGESATWPPWWRARHFSHSEIAGRSQKRLSASRRMKDGQAAKKSCAVKVSRAPRCLDRIAASHWESANGS